MKYADLLNSYIESSGLTLEQIADICKKKGVNIHPTYISKLRKGLRPSPGEEISRALAEACGKESTRLIFLGYLEKTPSPIVEKFAKYEDMFSAVRKALLQLCNDEEFLESLSKKIGHKITYEQLCEHFKNLSIIEQLDFMSSTDVSIEVSKNIKDELEILLDFTEKEAMPDNLLIPNGAIKLTNPQIVMLPVYGEVRAGVGGYAVQNYLGTKEWMAKNGNCKDCYMLQIKGDSMTPRFLPGDYAIVRPQNDVDNGEVAIVIVDDEEGVIKRIKKYPEDIILKSDNSLYEDREFCGQDCGRVKIIGKVIDIKAGRL